MGIVIVYYDSLVIINIGRSLSQ